MKNIVFFDLDNTIIKGYSLKLLISYLYKRKKIRFLILAKIYFWFLFYKINIIKNPKKIMEKTLPFIKNWRKEDLDKIINSFFNEIIGKRLNQKIINRVKIHLNNNDFVCIVSNSLGPLVNKVGEKIGVLNCMATELELINNVYSGKISGEIMYGDNKKTNALKIIEQINDRGKIYVYSDHHSDLPLFEIADKKIAVNPDRKLFDIAIVNNWEILE